MPVSSAFSDSTSRNSANYASVWEESTAHTPINGLNMEGLLDLIEEWAGKTWNSDVSHAMASASAIPVDAIAGRGTKNGTYLSLPGFAKATNAIKVREEEKCLGPLGNIVDDNSDNGEASTACTSPSTPNELSQRCITGLLPKRVQKVARKPKLRQSLSSEPDSELSIDTSSDEIYSVNIPKLYLFLRKLLQQPDEYQCIEWKDKATKTFRIVKPREIARLWGSTKHKPEMKYEHFARTLRGYVSKGLLKKPRQKLHYQFSNKFNLSF